VVHQHRILLLNLGYGTGLDGSLQSYLLSGWRYLWTPRRVLRSIDEGFRDLLSRVRPDICCLLEMHHDPELLSAVAAYRCRHVDTKYGKRSILQRLPFFRDNCNGVFSAERIACHIRFFRSGMKRLLYDLSLGDGLSLLVAHFSLHRSVRERQFQELAEVIADRKRVIVCGDFNDFGGRRELTPLLRSCNLRIVNASQPTFPACKPKRSLDLFLCSKDIDSVEAKVLSDVHLSDHLPVLLTVRA
jgi:endonuclease/exonuclease/phosphatase family metal-dependent hydrolase